MAFIEFDLDGEVLRYGTGQDAPTSNGGQMVLVPTLPSNIGAAYCLDGELRWYTNEQLERKRAHSKLNGTWSNRTMQWTLRDPVPGQWLAVRHERDQRLLACDWTQLPDVPLATKEAWAVYRQALRDITLQPDPFNIAWPVAPG